MKAIKSFTDIGFYLNTTLGHEKVWWPKQNETKMQTTTVS